MSSKELLKVIPGHWSAIENGVHYRRDVSFEEERCRVKNRPAAFGTPPLTLGIQTRPGHRFIISSPDLDKFTLPGSNLQCSSICRGRSIGPN
jgi:hypothetical protein